MNRNITGILPGWGSLKHRSYMAQKRLQHLLMRHIIPLNTAEKKAAVSGPRIFANSVPKSGTHLLRHILAMMPGVIDRWAYHYISTVCEYHKQLGRGMRGQIISTHMYWSAELESFLDQEAYKKFLMVRDLRDVCVSSAHYCVKDKRHRLHNYFNSLGSWDEQLAAVIKGIDANSLADGVRSKSIAEHVDGYIPWVHDPNCLIIRFEELVGAKGGGTVENQLDTIRQISGHIGLKQDESSLREIAERSFSNKTKTFRKGQIGGWQSEFSEGNIALFKQVAGQQLMELGYEQDYDW
jgi:hypothetical protein